MCSTMMGTFGEMPYQPPMRFVGPWKPYDHCLAHFSGKAPVCTSLQGCCENGASGELSWCWDVMIWDAVPRDSLAAQCGVHGHYISS